MGHIDHVRNIKDKTYPIAFAFLVAHFSHHVITAITSPLLPLIRQDLHISYAQSGIILSAFTLSYGIAQLPVGWLLHRVKSYVFIFMGIAGVGIAGLLIGLTGGFIPLVAFQLLMGLMGSGYHPTGIFFISQTVNSEKRGKALGIHTIGGSLSYFVSPIIAALLASGFGWRGAFIGLSVPIIVIGLLISFLVKRYTAGTSDNGRDTSSSVDEGKEVSWFRLVVVVILSVTIGAVMGSVIGFIPLYGVDILGMNEKLAATLIAVIFSAGFWASPLAGYISDRIGEIPMLIFAGVIAGPVVILLTFLKSGVPFYFFMVLIGMTIFIRMPVTESYIIGELNEKVRPTVLGIYFFASSMGGGIITPLMGLIADESNFIDSFRIAGVFLLVVVAVCVGLLLFSFNRKKFRQI